MSHFKIRVLRSVSALNKASRKSIGIMHPGKLRRGSKAGRLGTHLHCTERSAVQVSCARFLELVLNDGSFPFSSFFLSGSSLTQSVKRH